MSRAGSAAGGVRITGHASLFGRRDMAGDTVLPGAFAASLRRRGAAGVRMLYQHDAAEPVGHWLSVREDGAGLRVAGVIDADTRRGREAARLVEQGLVDGLSIGFRTARAVREAKGGGRRLVEVDLWEISLVTFPMLEAARIERPPVGDLAGRIRAAAGVMAG